MRQSYIRGRWLRLLKSVVSAQRFAQLSGVRLGNGCRILTKDFGSEPFLISIGDRVTLSGGVSFLNHDGSTWLIRDENGRRYHFRRIEIGSDVFVGHRAILMPGVRIGNRVIVGAGSVVTRSIPDNSVFAGNPARFVCSYDSYQARALELPDARRLTHGQPYPDQVAALLVDGFRPALPLPH
jgi:acetyltransferase-like isoleucine patch superfamily enzyme